MRKDQSFCYACSEKSKKASSWLYELKMCSPNSSPKTTWCFCKHCRANSIDGEQGNPAYLRYMYKEYYRCLCHHLETKHKYYGNTDSVTKSQQDSRASKKQQEFVKNPCILPSSYYHFFGFQILFLGWGSAGGPLLSVTYLLSSSQGPSLFLTSQAAFSPGSWISFRNGFEDLYQLSETYLSSPSR